MSDFLDAVLSCCSPGIMYYDTEKVYRKSIKKLLKVILRRSRTNYIYFLFVYVTDAPSERHAETSQVHALKLQASSPIGASWLNTVKIPPVTESTPSRGNSTPTSMDPH